MKIRQLEVINDDSNSSDIHTSRVSGWIGNYTVSKIMEVIMSSWWQDSYDTVTKVYEDDARLMLGLLASTSANASVKANVTLARKAFGEIQTYGKVKRESFCRTHYRCINQYVELGKFKGRKISALLECLTNPNSRHLPVDIWMLRAYGISRKAPTKREYDRIERSLLRRAKYHKMLPRDYQAKLWLQVRGKSDSYADHMKQGRLF